MNVIDRPSHDILWHSPNNDAFRIAEGARTCYQTPYKSAEDDERIIKHCFDSHHESVLEHSSMTVKFICDRGVSHELVRHRLASFSQESTRYCNYSLGKFSREISVVKPIEIKHGTAEYYIWEKQMEAAEKAYFDLLDLGVKPETARSALPTCLKTTVVVTANLREWYHIFDIRDAKDAQPDMRYMMHDLLLHVGDWYPWIFRDLLIERNKEFVRDFREKGIQ